LAEMIARSSASSAMRRKWSGILGDPGQRYRGSVH
jgi:hypothetical protein